ncbi:unnamed protein product [Cuscuta europaea]|uniref:Uncharacterized protein n=1 Tax=Cuscuta europaea TaxID=41803 RepID=A0A9P1E834_CUSEU|nr:unnamed protein product [Cuscuta europaea]
MTTSTLPMASMLPSSSPSTLSLRRRCFSVLCSFNSSRRSANISLPPVNPGDPLLTKLASVAARNPEALYSRTVILPIDFFKYLKGIVERSDSYNGYERDEPPPSFVNSKRLLNFNFLCRSSFQPSILCAHFSKSPEAWCSLS